jgi:hypothetical protein
MQTPTSQVATHTKLGFPTLAGCCEDAEVKAKPRAPDRQIVVTAKNTKILRTGGPLYGMFG